MSKGVVKDPVDYCADWALEAPISIPVPSELEHARFSLRAHAASLYACPLLSALSGRQQRRFIRQWLSIYMDMIEDIGYIATITRLADIGHAILRAFKHSNQQLTFESHTIFHESPLFTALRWLIRSNPSTDSRFYPVLDWVYEWHVFLNKTPLSRPDLQDPAYEAWIEVQNEVECWEDSTTPQIALKPIVSWLLEGYDSNEFPNYGKHGPGSTNIGAKTIAEKNRAYRPTRQTSELVVEHPVEISKEPFAAPSDSRLEFVAKDNKSLRTIGLEGPAEMTAQQSRKQSLYFMTDEGFLNLSRFVMFKDQRFSQRLALAGSRVKSDPETRPATIDLKDASNRVSIDLVCQAFSGNTLHDLMCGRSWYMAKENPDIDGVSQVPDLHELSMFAGMGNALTFPVQTTIFTALAVLAVSRTLYQRWFGCVDPDSYLIEDVYEEDRIVVDYVLHQLDLRRQYEIDNGLEPSQHVAERERFFGGIRVYGDDIIIPEMSGDAVRMLFQLLGKAGLRVNEHKSFFTPYACREACGVFAVNGVDITPLRFRIPVNPESSLMDTATYEALRSLTNRAFEKGRKVLYRMLIREIKTRQIFVSQKERDKKGHNPTVKKQRPYGYQPFGEIQFPVFQQFDANVVPLAIWSIRGDTASTHTTTYFGEPRRSITTWFPRLETREDKSSDLYHLHQAYAEWEYKALKTRFRGEDVDTGESYETIQEFAKSLMGEGISRRIPRSIRFKKRNAYINGHTTVGLEWAPA